MLTTAAAWRRCAEQQIQKKHQATPRARSQSSYLFDSLRRISVCSERSIVVIPDIMYRRCALPLPDAPSSIDRYRIVERTVTNAVASELAMSSALLCGNGNSTAGRGRFVDRLDRT